MTATIDFFDYTIVEGDDKKFTLTLTDADSGDPYDFTGTTKLWVTLKRDYADTDANAIVSINTIDDSSYVKYGIPDVGDGQVWFHLQDIQTVGLAQYAYVYYDVQVIQNGDILTLARGRIPWVDEVTAANS